MRAAGGKLVCRDVPGAERLPKASKGLTVCGVRDWAVCFNVSLPSVLVTSQWQVLKGNLNVKGSAELAIAAWMYVSAMNGIQARREKKVWDLPVGLPAPQARPGHVSHFLSKRFNDLSLMRWEGT